MAVKATKSDVSNKQKPLSVQRCAWQWRRAKAKAVQTRKRTRLFAGTQLSFNQP